MSIDEDSGFDPPLSEVSALFRGCRQAFLDVAEASGWEPGVGSWAGQDQKELRGVDPNESTSDRPSGFDLVREIAVSELEIASVHMEGLGALYDQGLFFLTPDLVSRAALEALGYALWMLAPEEEEDGLNPRVEASEAARLRLARAYLLEVASGLRDREVDRMRVDQSGLGASRLRDVRTRCRQVFKDATTSSMEGALDRPATVAGEVLPGPTAIVAYFFDTTLHHKVLLSDKATVKPVYGYLSTGTHPTLFRVREFRQKTQELTQTSEDLELPVAPPIQMARMMVGLFHLVLRAFSNYFGYPPGRCEELAEQIEGVFPGTLI